MEELAVEAELEAHERAAKLAAAKETLGVEEPAAEAAAEEEG